MRRRGRGPILVRSSVRAQSSVASSVAEGAAQEQEHAQAPISVQPPPPHQAHSHRHAHPETGTVAAASMPVGAIEAFAEPPQAQEQEQEKEETHGVYPGENVLPFTSELRMLRPEGVRRAWSLLRTCVRIDRRHTPNPAPPSTLSIQYPKHPVYRVLEPDGAVREGALEPQIEQAVAVQMYGTMARLQAMDQIFYNAQRQGRISFYMTSTGEVRAARAPCGAKKRVV